jgi:hypothetical protein
MSEISCARCVELGPELALNTLSDEARDQMVSHLDGCAQCRASVARFTESSDRLLEMMPEIAPPPGFDARVLTALRIAEPGPRRWGMLAAALIVAVALVSVGWLLGRPSDDTGEEDDTRAGTRTLLYSPLNGEHSQLGAAYLYPDDRAWMYLSTDIGPTATRVDCTAITPDHRSKSLGSYSLQAGTGSWRLPTAVPEGSVVVATLYEASGKMMGRAEFPPARQD